MKYQRHIVVKKTTAILLMTLMLFINVVKLFHTHPPVIAQVPSVKEMASHSHYNFQIRGTSQNEHCAICDFKLAKDTDVEETLHSLVPLVHIVVTSTPKLSIYLSVLQSLSPGRAPPAL